MDYQSGHYPPHHATATAAPVGGSAQGNTFDPMLLWITFRRHWYWMIPVGAVLAAVSAFFVLHTFVPQYQAKHHLAANRDFLIDRGFMPAPVDLAQEEKYLVTSPLVLSQVLADPGFHQFGLSDPDPEAREDHLIENLSVKSGGTKSSMVVSYTDENKKFAAEICNAIVTAYLQRRDEFDNRRINRMQNWLTGQVEDLRRAVEDQKRSVARSMSEAYGISDGEAVAMIENNETLTLAEQLRSQISDLKIELAFMDAGIGIRNPSEDDNLIVPSINQFVPDLPVVERGYVTSAMIQGIIERDPDVFEAREKFERYRSEVLELEVSEMWRFDKPAFERLEKQRDEWKERLDEARKKAAESAKEIAEAELDESYERRKQYAEEALKRQRELFAQNSSLKQEELSRRAEMMSEHEKLLIRDRRDQLQKRLAVLQDRYNEETDRLRQVGESNAELEFARAELASAQLMHQKLRDRLRSIQVESGRNGSVNSVSPATPPTRPIESMPTKKMVMAGGVCFAIPFALGLLWEFRTRRVTDCEVLARTHQIAPILGELARAPRASSGKSSRNRRVFEESVDTLRANLELSKSTRHARTFAIVSSMSGEGKSTAVSQLAISLAKASGKTVLIIDADMRCPDQHDAFGIPLEPGLNEVLRGVESLDSAVNRELGDLIHVLPAGRLKVSPHRLISRESITKLLGDAREQYEYVIIDTPPVLSAGETLSVAAAVDSTLVCVMRDVTRMDSVVRTTHRLEASGASVVGTIFNGITPGQYAYRYGDYRYGDMNAMFIESSEA